MNSGCSTADDTSDSDVPPAAAVADAGPDVVVEVATPVVFDGSASRGVGFRWDFGDGTTADAVTVEHTYASPGNYTAVLRVTGEDGGWRTDSAHVIAHRPVASPRPVASSTIAVGPDGRAWAVQPESDRLVMAFAGGSVLALTCDDPRSLAVDRDTIFVGCADGAVASHPDNVLPVSLPIGDGRGAMGVVLRDGRWAAALARGEVWTDDGTVWAAADPRALAMAPDGRVYAPRFRSPGDGGEIAISDGSDPIRLAPARGTDSDTASRGVPNLLGAVAISPDGGTLVVGGSLANVYRGLYRDGQPLTFETTVRAYLTGVDLASGEEIPGFQKQLDNQGHVGALVFSPLGDRLYVLHPYTGTVQILDGWDLDVLGSIHGVGIGASGLAVSPEGDILYVDAWLDREIRAYDVSDLSVAPPLMWTAGTVDDEPLTAEVLRGKQLFHDAWDRRIARDGYVTCASCHPDGEHDGRTWDFTDRGEGLRNTISLEGRGGTAMGRVHWTGNFDEIQDFENDVRHGFGGEGFLSDADFAECEDPLGPAKAGRDADLDALAAYVASLVEPIRSPYLGDPDGEALFAAHGCADCHGGGHLTDSTLENPVRHDVGTITDASGGRLGGPLDGFDTPTLLGVWATGPWLHDGSAATLEQAVDAHDGVELTDDELAAVARYLRGL